MKDYYQDELILALELYFRVNSVHTSDSNPEIKKLSKILNSLPIHPKNLYGYYKMLKAIR